MKKLLKIILSILLVVVIAAAAYVAYVFISYHRIADMLPLEIVGDASELTAPAGEELKIMSWNIGFGAYEVDFDFFMDGGTHSWAFSKERLTANMENIAKTIAGQEADIYFVQEVDIDATRSYHVDERVPIIKVLPGYQSDFAQNYDSPFLMYPLTQPHGASKAGILTFSRFRIKDGLRRSLPIETSVMKLVDLDRCYSISTVDLDNGKQLKLYNLHLSAYTSDGTIAVEQMNLLLADMQAEYEKGNYCLAGGDFNKDLLGDSSVYFGKPDKEYTWAQPLPEDTFDGLDLSLVAPLNEDDPVPSCRNCDAPYNPGQFVLTVDGFVVSDNIEVVSSEVLDLGFAYSDHNPVVMNFVLK